MRALGMRLCTQAPEMGYPAVLLKIFFSRTAAFPKGQQNGEKKNFYNSSLRLISVWFE